MKNKPKIEKRAQLKIEGSLTSDALFLAVLSGLLLFLSFPKYGSGWFAWIAFLPLLFALKKAGTVMQGMLLGFIAGLVGNVGIIYWIAFVIVNYGYLPLYVGIVLMLLLACYLSVYVSLFAGSLVFFRRRIPLYWTAPVLWVCLEYLKSVLLTGFPWENLGYSQYLNTYFIQMADVTGVAGLSFLIVLTNVAIFEIIDKRSFREYVLTAAVCLMIAGSYAYGIYRLNQMSKVMRNAPDMEVSLIQGNIDQSIKWSEQYQKETMNIYERLSLKNVLARGSLIVWPETAAPFDFQNKIKLRDQIINLSKTTGNWIVFGSVSYSPDKDKQDFFNSAFLLSPDGDIRGRYDKVHLVPYGEYVPLRKMMPFINGLTADIGDFSTGAGYGPLSMDNRKIGVLICYEGILPFAARAYKNRSAELLVNITNDAWFGTTSAPYQHFSMAVFRAVETRLYLVRAANTGISGIIDPRGKIIAATKIFQEDALKGHVQFVSMPTFYAIYGDLPVAVCFVLMLIYFLISLKREEK